MIEKLNCYVVFRGVSWFLGLKITSQTGTSLDSVRAYILRFHSYIFSCCTYLILDKKSKFVTVDKLCKDFYVNKMLYLTFGRHTTFTLFL